MLLLLAGLLGLATAHQSANGGEGFSPHWETPRWTIGGVNNEYGAEQDDNYYNKDDDRRVYAPAYDDNHSYQHHPKAHQMSDEHFMDDEGQSTRVIHGQDTSRHFNRKEKKKVYDTIKEPKHHFAVQQIDVPFPFHHHYYNHTKVHYHDGYDLYDDDVGDSEKYYHVNPDTHTNVDGWFADDHYRISNEVFSDDGAAADDGFVSGRAGSASANFDPNSRTFENNYNDNDAGNFNPNYRSEFGPVTMPGSQYPDYTDERQTWNGSQGSYVLNSEGLDGDDGPNRVPSTMRFRWFQDERQAPWRMDISSRDHFKNARAGLGNADSKTQNTKFYETGRRNRQETRLAQAASTSTARDQQINNAGGSGAGFSQQGTTTNESGLGNFQAFNPDPTNNAGGNTAGSWTYADQPLTGAGTVGNYGGKLGAAGTHDTWGSDLLGTGKGHAYTEYQVGHDTANAYTGAEGKWDDTAGGAKENPPYPVAASDVTDDDLFVGHGSGGVNAATGNFAKNQQGMGERWGITGGALNHYAMNWDNIDDSYHPRSIRENTRGQDDSDENDTQPQGRATPQWNDNDGNDGGAGAARTPYTWGGFYRPGVDMAGAVSDAAQQAAQALAASVAGFIN